MPDQQPADANDAPIEARDDDTAVAALAAETAGMGPGGGALGAMGAGGPGQAPLAAAPTGDPAAGGNSGDAIPTDGTSSSDEVEAHPS